MNENEEMTCTFGVSYSMFVIANQTTDSDHPFNQRAVHPFKVNPNIESEYFTASVMTSLLLAPLIGPDLSFLQRACCRSPASMLELRASWLWRWLSRSKTLC